VYFFDEYVGAYTDFQQRRSPTNQLTQLGISPNGAIYRFAYFLLFIIIAVCVLLSAFLEYRVQYEPDRESGADEYGRKPDTGDVPYEYDLDSGKFGISLSKVATYSEQWAAVTDRSLKPAFI